MTSCICPKCGDAHVPDEPVQEEHIPEIVATQRCPVCWAHGHSHRTDCKYAALGMQNHVPYKRA